MAWKNIFDAGDCTVLVMAADYTIIDESEWINLGIESITVVDGEVVIEGNDVTGSTIVVVRPDFDTEQADVRVTGVQMQGADVSRHVGAALDISMADWPPPVQSVELVPSVSSDPYTYTPDPVTFAGGSVTSLSGIIIGAGT